MVGLQNSSDLGLHLTRWESATPFERRQVIVLANRAPFRHERTPDGRISVTRTASGLVTAIEPFVKACSGIWVAHGAGSADAACVDDRDGLNVPPANPCYRLRYVTVPDDEHRGYYYGFANEGLWPLCHAAHVQPVFRSGDFRMYRTVNRRFASAVCEEAVAPDPLIFVNDYHFALAPRMLRSQLALSNIVTFWHIPWPTAGTFRICPWRRDLMEGLLGSDIVGFQTEEDCASFLESAAATLECDVDRAQGEICHRGRSILVRTYPIGIEWNNRFAMTAPPAAECRERVCRDLGLGADVQIGIGVDRLDYTKGIREKFVSVGRMLEMRPELRGRFVFVQVAEPSRDCLPAYRTARAQIVDACDHVNGRFAAGDYRPIVLLESHHEPADVYRLYRAADLCYVGSLHDGMNLVAKEFVCAREDERGVLVLSEFAGASRQLTGAVTVNPYAIDESALALARALAMPDTEQSKRMRRMRTSVASFDTYWWAGQILGDAMRAPAARQSDRRMQPIPA
jgi:trehalose 6-phosphate synthase